MLIKIVKGVYGHRISNQTIPKTAENEPFEVPTEVGARLIRRKVAVLAEDLPNIPPKNEVKKSESILESSVGASEYEELTMEELKEVALANGISDEEVKKAKKKAELIALIENSQDNISNSQEPEDELLELSAEGPVE